MKEIPIKVFARQSLSVMLEQSLYEISLKECNGIMAATIIRDGVTIVSNRRVCAGMTVIPEGHLEEGNFVILTENGEIPYYTDFESSNVFVYLTLQEVEELRLMEYTGPAPNTIPSGPLVDFDYMTGKLADGMTLTRASPATYIQGGVIKTAATNVARFESNGLLVEDSSTNILLQSSNFSNSTWSGNRRVSIVSGQTGPDGLTSASKITPTIDNNNHQLGQAFNLLDYSDHSISVFAKPNGYKVVRLRLTDSVALWADAVVDLSTGKKISGSANVFITPLTNGWVRLSIPFTPRPTATTSMFYGLWVYDNSGNPTFAGDGVSGVLVFGAQAERSPYTTSYIATTTTTVTRAADVVALMQTGAKTVYREYVPLGSTAVVKELVAFNGTYCPPGNLQKLKVWNRSLTDTEAKTLGVPNV